MRMRAIDKIGYMKNAQAIKDRALTKMMDKDYEAFMESTDFLEQELEKAYVNLKAKVGKHRADEVALDLIKIAF